MDRLEILVEEQSIGEFLKIVLPQLLPEGWLLGENCFVRVHEGKQDLQQSIPRKIRAGRNKGIGFIILQDQDSSHCLELKEKLIGLCEGARSNADVPYKVRIVCHELEAWYLGDMGAIEKVFPRFRADKYRNKRKFSQPDQCINPKQELKKIVGSYSQIEIAREMAKYMTINQNKSKSFRSFVSCFIGEGRFVNPIV